ncbi:MAG: hypothetical protein LBT37_01910 [Lactobacillaceae bacterium]|jgi:hypothetical protein|nr:hypothetical protein [Lactobacillaceae bacterium]
MKKAIIITSISILTLGALATTSLWHTNTQSKYAGAREINLQLAAQSLLQNGKTDSDITIQKTGYYVVQLRGADGGSNSGENTSGSASQKGTIYFDGGRGGYVEGLVYLTKDQTVQVNVGTAGSGTGQYKGPTFGNAVQDLAGGTNQNSRDINGGIGIVTSSKVSLSVGGSGGGSTDFRVNGTKMAVAGGGGGAVAIQGTYTNQQYPTYNSGSDSNHLGTGGSGGFVYAGNNNPNGHDGNYASPNNQTTDLLGKGATLTDPGSAPDYFPDAKKLADNFYSFPGTAGDVSGVGYGGRTNMAGTMEDGNSRYSGGAGGAGYHGGSAGGSGKDTSGGRDLIWQASAGGGGGSSYVDLDYNKDVTSIVSVIPELKDFRDTNAGSTATSVFGGGRAHKDGAAKIYFISTQNPLPSTSDQVSQDAVKMKATN